MSYLKPPYTKKHIITLAAITFFLGVGLLFYFKNSPLLGDPTNKQSDQLEVKAEEATGATLKQDYETGIERLNDGNDVGALLIDNLMIIDVRPAEEYAQGHIAGSHNIIVDELKNALLMETSNIVIYATDQDLLQQGVAALQGKKVASVQTLHTSLSQLESDGYTIVKE